MFTVYHPSTSVGQQPPQKIRVAFCSVSLCSPSGIRSKWASGGFLVRNFTSYLSLMSCDLGTLWYSFCFYCLGVSGFWVLFDDVMDFVFFWFHDVFAGKWFLSYLPPGSFCHDIRNDTCLYMCGVPLRSAPWLVFCFYDFTWIYFFFPLTLGFYSVECSVCFLSHD